MANSWLRLYHDFITDEKIVQLAFEDQRHYIGILILKSNGTLDRSKNTNPDLLNKIVAQSLWISHDAIREVKNRLMQVNLIDEAWQPLGWDKRQFVSDNSTERVKRHREKMQQETENKRKKHETLQKRYRNVTETKNETLQKRCRNESNVTTVENLNSSESETNFSGDENLDTNSISYDETLQKRYCNGADTDTDTEKEEDKEENNAHARVAPTHDFHFASVTQSHRKPEHAAKPLQANVSMQARGLTAEIHREIESRIRLFDRTEHGYQDEVSINDLLRAGIDKTEILSVWRFAINDAFWSGIVATPKDLKKHWVKIYQNKKAGENKPKKERIDLSEDDDWMSPILATNQVNHAQHFPRLDSDL